MKDKILNLDEFARRVDSLSNRKSILLSSNQIKMNGIRLSLAKRLLENKQAFVKAPGMKNPQKMLAEDDKKVPILRAAYTTYKCCQNQDLHLFQLQKIYLEKGSTLKKVVGWKLPKRKVVQEHLKALVEGLKQCPNTHKRHLITRIAISIKSQVRE